ncbi:MAG: hypothetical protein ACLTK0_08850 [Anaerovoracaceae bacterium]
MASVPRKKNGADLGIIFDTMWTIVGSRRSGRINRNAIVAMAALCAAAPKPCHRQHHQRSAEISRECLGNV